MHALTALRAERNPAPLPMLERGAEETARQAGASRPVPPAGPNGEAVQWSGVVQLLLRARLLSHRELLGSRIEVTPLAGRNGNVMICVDKRARLVVRHCPVDPEVLRPSAEAALLDFLRGKPGLAHAVPRCVYASDADNCLILDYVHDSDNLRLYWARRRAVPTCHCKRLGTLLAALHTAALPPEHASTWRAPRPAILKLRAPRASHYLDSSPATLKTIQLLQRSPALQDALRWLDEEWQPTNLCHNDVRSENLLLTRAAPKARVSGLVLVDWELAGMGDPAWDVAGALGEYAGYWINAIPTASQFPPGRFVPWAAFSAQRMAELSRGFWSEYRKVWAQRAGSGDAERLLSKALRFVPARLVQSVIERGQRQAGIELNSGMLLQLAENLARDPAAARSVFGLS